MNCNCNSELVEEVEALEVKFSSAGDVIDDLEGEVGELEKKLAINQKNFLRTVLISKITNSVR